ncbi:chromate resistance protein [Thiocystis minor]|uniref:chromate resistance protein ChrB domain-containing protein n=1 Tax=Thiocystis minor TaxID=61597 RepID=UPI001F5C5CAA|nr:chromate resistance protein ChrB domain-containing protein [Thiocystis minor]MBK5964568.1 chromate resistance protein [Thiocystis minor]
MSFLALFISLPSKASTGRMRVWRALKALGCATLRDGVYLLPESSEHATALEEVAGEALDAQGSGEVYRLSGCDDAQEARLRSLFDRGEDYAAVVEDARRLRADLKGTDGAAAVGRRMQSLTRRFEQVVRVDFFPGESQRQALAVVDESREVLARHLSPDEPTARQTAIASLDRTTYRNRTWATRARPWVDRLASAWLIRRFIDPDAHIVWLASPADCRADWLGFDFDGAAFSHVGTKVTFETLLASFGLESDSALARLGELVHCLDVGGLPVHDAPGIESLLAGLRASESDDDTLLARASEVFDWLLRTYKEQTQ